MNTHPGVYVVSNYVRKINIYNVIYINIYIYINIHVNIYKFEVIYEFLIGVCVISTMYVI